MTNGAPISPPDQNRSEYRAEYQPWLVFFAFSSFLTVALLMLHSIPARMLAGLNPPESKSDRVIEVLLENEKSDRKKEKENVVFLSDKNTTASGDLTRRRGFEALSHDHRLSFSKRGSRSEETTPEKKQKKKVEFTAREADFYVQLFEETRRQVVGLAGKNRTGSSERTRIPSNYRFRNEFALSWDRNGNPRIPTKRYEHYTYFRNMLDKIQAHWAPPGGQPYPVFGDSYHSMSGYAPGRTSFQSFPSQDVKLVFMLNEAGDVIDARIHSSLGYSSLDASCIAAIERSRNFGPPPSELIEKGTLIIPMVFRIIIR